MNEEFIIDGTNIICNAGQDNNLAPLLQLLLLIKEQGHSFYCYFDADTRYKFDKEVDKQVYQNLIKFGLNDHFIQVTNLDADEALLQQAHTVGAKVISTDDFEDFYNTYPWLAVQNNPRLLKVDIIAEKLMVETLNINIEVERDTILLVTELVNLLENQSDNLHGTIDKYKKERQFGFIKRNFVNKNIFFSKKAVVDKNLDYTVKGTEVTFKIELSKSGSIYYFCAVDVRKREIKSAEKALEDLADENKQLKVAKNTLQEQTAKAKATLEQELEKLKERNKTLEAENQTLTKEVTTYKGSASQTIRALEKEKQQLHQDIDGLTSKNTNLQEVVKTKDVEIEQLKAQIAALLDEKNTKEAETNELAMVVDVQEEKIKTLDDDLKSTLQMFEFQDLDESEQVQYQQLRKDYEVIKNALVRKNSKIVFLLNNINDLQKQLSLNATEVVNTGKASSDVDGLLERIQELEKNNAELLTKFKNLKDIKPTNRRTPRKSVTRNQSDSEDITAPSSSRPSKLSQKPKPRAIKDIPLTELQDWWHNLSEVWQKAFNQAVLSRGEILHIPTEEQLRSIFERKKIDIVGSGILLYGLNQLSFKLTDLSGLKDLKHLTELNLSGHDFTDLEGIENFEQLELLNCTSNRITSLRHIKKLSNLKTLIMRDNDLVNFDGIETLEEIEYINALYNQKLRSIAGVEDLPNLQTLCIPTYKTKIIKQIEKLKKVNPDVEIQNV